MATDILYLETSAWLTWLLGEPESLRLQKILDKAAAILTSRLTLIECERALIVAEESDRISPADRMKALGVCHQKSSEWVIMEIHEEIALRASQRFPIEPVRSLDAIHLATALQFLQAEPTLKVVSLDKRILLNLTPLGLKSV